jgi:hypothetical protein
MAEFKSVDVGLQRGFDHALQFQLVFSPDADMRILEKWLEGG